MKEIKFFRKKRKMKKKEIVPKAEDFNNIINNNQKHENKYFVIYYNKNNLEISRYGFAVGKKIGNAVTRNKYRRQLKSIVDKNKLLFPKGLDYIIIMKKECKNLVYKEIEQNLVKVFLEEHK